MEMLAQIIGYVAVTIGVVLFVSTRRKTLLLLKMLSDLLWTVNMLFLGLYSGAALCGISACRSFVFYHREDKKWAKSNAWLVFFLAATLVSPIMTWEGPISLLPAFGSVLACLGYFARRPLVIKALNLPGVSCWCLYGLLSANYPSAINEAISLFSLLVGLVRELLLLRKSKQAL